MHDSSCTYRNVKDVSLVEDDKQEANSFVAFLSISSNSAGYSLCFNTNSLASLKTVAAGSTGRWKLSS